MHIPQATTDTLELELFEPALERALQPAEDYDVSRWLYVPNCYSEYRYILGTRGKNPLICSSGLLYPFNSQYLRNAATLLIPPFQCRYTPISVEFATSIALLLVMTALFPMFNPP